MKAQREASAEAAAAAEADKARAAPPPRLSRSSPPSSPPLKSRLPSWRLTSKGDGGARDCIQGA